MEGDFFNLADPGSLQWLWLLIPLIALFVLDARRRQRVLRLFVSQSLLDDVCPRRSVGRPIVKFGLLLAGLGTLVFALARPRWDPQQIELEQQGQNLLFCLDVSNSMRARDVDPNRLEAAKEAIRSLVSRLPAGNQVGLLAYAGTAELKCPLTPNYSHFLSVLPKVSFNSVDVGGSNLGDAIDYAVQKVFGLKAAPGQSTTADGKPEIGKTLMKDELPREPERPDVMLIFTDGENHEGFAREMAQNAHALGVGLYIIGVGTETGGPIPIEGEDGTITNLKYKGEEVITQFDRASLQAVIESLPSRCGFLPAGRSAVDLHDVYTRVISQQGSQSKKLKFTLWQEKFQLFVGLGMALVVLSTLISEQRPARAGAGR